MSENKKSVEESFNEIESIIAEMQKEDVTLDRSFELYNQGLTLIKECNEKLDSMEKQIKIIEEGNICLLYTSDAADDLLCVDLGGRRIIKKKK